MFVEIGNEIEAIIATQEQEGNTKHGLKSHERKEPNGFIPLSFGVAPEKEYYIGKPVDVWNPDKDKPEKEMPVPSYVTQGCTGKCV